MSIVRPETSFLYRGQVTLPADLYRKGTWTVSEKYLPVTSDQDWLELHKIMRRMDDVCREAERCQVRLMMDAEQTYYQPAIDLIALLLMHKYNATSPEQGPLLYNTYQLYLKDGLERLRMDLTRSKRAYDIADPLYCYVDKSSGGDSVGGVSGTEASGVATSRSNTTTAGPSATATAASRRTAFQFGCKIVRGAYMTSERKRAQELDVRDPVQVDITTTHRDYNAAATLLLERASNVLRDPAMRVSFVVASHNKESIVHVCHQMNRLHLPAQDGTVHFAQLLGGFLWKEGLR